MTVAGINIDEAIKNMQSQLAADKNVSPALKTSMNLLIMIVSMLLQRLTLDSSNSSLLPSTDKIPRRMETLFWND